MTTNEPDDEYQRRYVAHQARKAETLATILAERYSDRMFANTDVDDTTLIELTKPVQQAPTSCNRQAVTTTVVTGRDQKALLGGVLVGGVGWIHRAPAVILFMADAYAYKAGDEITYMPYLDAGIAIGHVWLQATALGLAAAYSNPNLRPMNRDHFENVFGGGLFCGALAVGWPHPLSPDRAHHEQKRTAL